MTPPPEADSAATRAALLTPGARYMIASAFAFSLMSVLVKVAGERLPSQEIVLVRAVVTLVLSYGLLRARGLSPWGNRRGLLLARGLLGFGGLSCFFYAVTHLPLADATVIHFLNPVFTAVLAGLLLRERTGGGLAAALVLSFSGVLLVTRPALLFGERAAALPPFAVTVAVGGAVFSALAYVCVRVLSRTEDPLVIVFYFPLVAVPASIPTAWSHLLWPTPFEWLVLLGVGAFTQVAQVWLTRGLRLEAAGRAMTISYLQIAFAATWGLLLFGERVDALSVVGSAAILAGSFFAGRARGSRAPSG